MKKLGLLLMLLLAMAIGNHRIFGQSVTITLMPGWNWISVPLMDTLDFQTAMGTVTPVDGDIIKSHWGSAAYSNGQWRGTISQFYPGYGYHYKSNRMMPVMVTFNAQQPAPQVIVTTMEPTDITTNSATCGGNVASSDGNYVFVLLRGICWSINPNPTINDNYVVISDGLGSFTTSMTELVPNTTYYVRAYAVTNNRTYYGEQKVFTTIESQAGIWVDLGIPSGNLWAICNVGATTPEDYGDYFAWGETSHKDSYNWINYQYCNGNYNTLTKYCKNSSYGYNGFTDNLTILQPIDDAATTNWGSEWHIPNYDEWVELYQNTTYTWYTLNGVNGYLFTAPNGNSLFLPASGYYDENSIGYSESIGYYWSKMLDGGLSYQAWFFCFNSNNHNLYCNERYYGFSIRPVRSAPQN